MGGLGNQMFQYAFGRQLAIDRNTNLGIDLSWFDEYADVDTLRFYELDCFNIQEHFINRSDFVMRAWDEKTTPKRLAYLYTKALRKPKLRIYLQEGHNFKDQVLRLPNNTYIEGWWQSEKFFKPIRPVLLDDFSFKEPPSGNNKKILEQIKKSPAVSLHVRRGDYVFNAHANKFHGLKGLDYYQAALKHITKKLAKPTLFVFSDDLDWCKQNLKLDARMIFVEGNKKGSEDMRLMMHCQHNITANSSFSWWAAWLNKNPDKIVIAPKQWFNEPGVDTSDVIPESWIKI